MTRPYLMYLNPDEPERGNKIEWRTQRGPGTIAQLSDDLAKEHPADLDIATTKDEQGLEQITISVDPDRKKARLEQELIKEEEVKWDQMRNERNRRISETDYIVLRDSPFGFFEKRKWKTYRQELRDLPSKIEDINNFEWPIKPSDEKETEDENVE